MSDNPAARWVALREAVREAKVLGVKFRVVGDTVEIAGDLPHSLRDRLVPGLLYDFLSAARADAEALDFAGRFGIAAVLVEDAAGLADAIDELTGAEVVAIDVETAPQDYRPEPVRINKDGSVAIRQPTSNATALCPYRSAIQCAELFGGGEHVFVCRGEALQELIHGDWLRQQRLTSHNALFESVFLKRHADFTPARPIECSMQASGLIYGVRNRSLADTSLNIIGVEPPKELATSCWNAPQLSPGQVAYAGTDAILTWISWFDLDDKLQKTGRSAAYELQRDVVPAVADMQLRGLGFDLEVHARQTDIWARELASARHDYVDLTGQPPPSTPAEIRAWLTEVAADQLATWPRTDGGLLSTKANNLKRLILSGEPTVKPVLAILAKQHLLSNFGPGLRNHINPVTGRLHASYNIAGAKSGRFTCSRPNLQQLPAAKAPDFKSCIVAAPGNVLVGGDWSQIELRAAAWLSGDPVLTAVYEDGRDLHTETAARIAGVPVDQVTPEQRAAAKAINFGSIYGIGARSLAQDAFASYGVEMTEAEARAALSRFFDTYRTLKSWMTRHADLCQRRGYVEIGSGRVVLARWEIETRGHLSYPQCCNLPVQGAAADAMLRALPTVHRRMAGIVASVHDEILLEVAEDDAEAAAQILEEAMTEAFEQTFPGAPSHNVVAVATGKSWCDLK